VVLGGVFTLVAWLLHGSGVGGMVVAALAWLGGPYLTYELVRDA